MAAQDDLWAYFTPRYNPSCDEWVKALQLNPGLVSSTVEFSGKTTKYGKVILSQRNTDPDTGKTIAGPMVIRCGTRDAPLFSYGIDSGVNNYEKKRKKQPNWSYAGYLKARNVINVIRPGRTAAWIVNAEKQPVQSALLDWIDAFTYSIAKKTYVPGTNQFVADVYLQKKVATLSKKDPLDRYPSARIEFSPDVVLLDPEFQEMNEANMAAKREEDIIANGGKAPPTFVRRHVVIEQIVGWENPTEPGAEPTPITAPLVDARKYIPPPDVADKDKAQYYFHFIGDLEFDEIIIDDEKQTYTPKLTWKRIIIAEKPPNPEGVPAAQLQRPPANLAARLQAKMAEKAISCVTTTMDAALDDADIDYYAIELARAERRTSPVAGEDVTDTHTDQEGNAEDGAPIVPQQSSKKRSHSEQQDPSTLAMEDDVQGFTTDLHASTEGGVYNEVEASSEPPTKRVLDALNEQTITSE